MDEHIARLHSELGGIPASAEGGYRLDPSIGGAQHERLGRVEVPDDSAVTRCQ